MLNIEPHKLAHSLMQVHIQTELNLTDIKLLDYKQSQKYINELKFIYKPLSTVMVAERVMGSQWNIYPLHD